MIHRFHMYDLHSRRYLLRKKKEYHLKALLQIDQQRGFEIKCCQSARDLQ